MAELVARIDGLSDISAQLSQSIDHLPIPSSLACALGIPKRRIHAVRLPMDELFAYARDKRTKHYSHVGYLPGQGLMPIVGCSLD